LNFVLTIFFIQFFYKNPEINMESLFRKTVFRGIVYSLIFFQASALICAEKSPEDRKGKGKAKGQNLKSLIGPNLNNCDDGDISPGETETAGGMLSLSVQTPCTTSPGEFNTTDRDVSSGISFLSPSSTEDTRPLNRLPETRVITSSLRRQGPSGSPDKSQEQQNRRRVSFAQEESPTEQQAGPSSPRPQDSIESSGDSGTPTNTSKQQAGTSCIDERAQEYNTIGHLRSIFGPELGHHTVMVESNLFSSYEPKFFNALLETSKKGTREMINYLLSFVEVGYTDRIDQETASSIFYCNRGNTDNEFNFSLIGQALQNCKNIQSRSIMSFIEIILSPKYLKIRNYSGKALITEVEVESALMVAIQQGPGFFFFGKIFDIVLNRKDADGTELITTETINSIVFEVSNKRVRNDEEVRKFLEVLEVLEGKRAKIIERDSCCTLL
jgi:hypothetical protein